MQNEECRMGVTFSSLVKSVLNEECRMKTPSYPPVRGRLYTFFGLRFTNCVSAIFHSSLFTLHFSLKET